MTLKSFLQAIRRKKKVVNRPAPIVPPRSLANNNYVRAPSRYSLPKLATVLNKHMNDLTHTLDRLKLHAKALQRKRAPAEVVNTAKRDIDIADELGMSISIQLQGAKRGIWTPWPMRVKGGGVEWAPDVLKIMREMNARYAKRADAYGTEVTSVYNAQNPRDISKVRSLLKGNKPINAAGVNLLARELRRLEKKRTTHHLLVNWEKNLLKRSNNNLRRHRA